MDKIIERIEREAGVPGLVTLLAERLEPTDLQSLLLEVYRRRVERRPPSAVLADYQANRFVRPARVSPVRLTAWEQACWAQLPPDFERIALSPVCPLGTCTAVAPVDVNWSVATARNTEVVSDSTNVLALECALRRREMRRVRPRSTEAVHLAAGHRVLRAQHYDNPDLVPHFHLFALCSAGRDTAGRQFGLLALSLHARFYLRALRAFLGPTVPLGLAVSDLGAASRDVALETQLLAPIRDEFAGVDCRVDPERTSGRGYYAGFCFHVYATSPAGRRLELADGGVVDWTQKLLSDHKERLVISGIGSERVCSPPGGVHGEQP
jgi:hypothetical protein